MGPQRQPDPHVTLTLPHAPLDRSEGLDLRLEEHQRKLRILQETLGVDPLVEEKRGERCLSGPLKRQRGQWPTLCSVSE